MSIAENSAEAAANGTSPLRMLKGPVGPVDKSAIAVTINLSESDRWFPATVLNQMKWGGGEQVIASLGRIYESLRLEEVNLAKTPAQLASKAEPFVLSGIDAELTLNLICGTAGTAMAGVVGPLLAKLARRMRKMIDDAVAVEKKRLEDAAMMPTEAKPAQ